jgi:hypothetical protein
MIVMQVVRLFSDVGVELNESLAPCRIPLPLGGYKRQRVALAVIALKPVALESAGSLGRSKRKAGPKSWDSTSIGRRLTWHAALVR